MVDNLRDMTRIYVRKIKKNLANIITMMRVVLSLPLLLSEPLSPSFYILYCLCGLSDMVDGFVARRTNSESRFGERIDSLADIVFVAVCLCKLLPVIELPVWVCVWAAVIALIKVVNVAIGFVLAHSFLSLHAMMNKITGFTLFLFPFLVGIKGINIVAASVCMLASLAAIQEFLVVIKTNSAA